MIPLDSVQAIWQETANPLILRQFVGDTAVGWKVAWSDRMVYMYTSPLLFGLAFWPLRRRLKPLTLWGFLLKQNILEIPEGKDKLGAWKVDIS